MRLPDDSGAAGIVLRLEGITKRFGELVANDAIDLELRRGEVLALLGENGAGKTTLTSILFGHYVADAGRVLVADRAGTLLPLPPGSPNAALAAGVGMVHQHFTLAANLSVLDNVVLGTEPLWRWRRHRRAARRRLEGLMRDAGLEVPLEALVGSLSVGERQRVEILKALYRDVQALILDEPTAVLTPQEAERLFATLDRLARAGLAILFISHKLDEVVRLCRRVVVLRVGRKVAEFAVVSTSAASMAEAMVGRAVTLPRRESLAAGRPVLELEGVDVADPGGDGRGAAGLTLTVHAHELVGVAGVSGNGQRALADLLAGLAPPLAGQARLLGRPWPQGGPRAATEARVGRVPEDRLTDGTVAEMSVAENLALETYRRPALQRFGLVCRGRLAQHARALIAAYDVRCEGPDQRIGLLSGGNMQKLLLGRVLELDPLLLLADQPTRGLDVGAVAFVHGRLLDARRRGAGIVLISEDLDELMRLSDRVAVMHRGRLSEAMPASGVTVRELGLLMTGQVRHAA
ncbi:MAG TPA: ABC transporter ATP-binding protein [Geminicoccaceae bacterium]|nr:ABC transporter ATP-binding protein [Geminicoccaceae bacterium]